MFARQIVSSSSSAKIFTQKLQFMSSNPAPTATAPRSPAAPQSKNPAANASIVASIFGGADLKDLFTQQGMRDILNWSNPVLSTFFFLFTNLCIYIIFYGNYSLVSVACYLAMAHLIVTFSLCQIGQFMARFQSGTFFLGFVANLFSFRAHANHRC